MIDDNEGHNLQVSDPLDALLHDAFAREMAGIADIDISAQVMGRLRRRLRVRAITLAISTFAGLGIALALALPGVTDLLDWLASAQPLSPGLTAVLPVLVVVALTPWLFAMVDDRV
jgi:hypothetical protein